MSRDFLVPVYVKIDRAKEHLQALEVEAQAFINATPYEAIESSDPATRNVVVWLKVHASPPLRWSAILGDVFHNLRSSLDVLVYQLIIVNGKWPEKTSAFPIYVDQADFNRDGIRKVKGVSAEAQKLLRAIKPYKDGNLRLWQLHQLNNVDKHRLIVPVGSAYRNIIIDASSVFRRLQPDWDLPPAEIALKPADRQFPLKDGAVLFTMPTEARTQGFDLPKFTFELAFGEGEIIQGEPITPTLHEFVGLVQGIAEQFRPFLCGSTLSLQDD